MDKQQIFYDYTSQYNYILETTNDLDRQYKIRLIDSSTEQIKKIKIERYTQPYITDGILKEYAEIIGYRYGNSMYIEDSPSNPAIPIYTKKTYMISFTYFIKDSEIYCTKTMLANYITNRNLISNYKLNFKDFILKEYINK